MRWILENTQVGQKKSVTLPLDGTSFYKLVDGSNPKTTENSRKMQTFGQMQKKKKC